MQEMSANLSDTLLTPARSLRRWFQFTLRTLFVVTTVVAAVAGYAAKQYHIVREREEWLRTRAVPPAIEFRMGTLEDVLQHSQELRTKGDTGRRPPWFRAVLGDRAQASVYLPNDSTDADFARAARLFPEADVYRSLVDLPIQVVEQFRRNRLTYDGPATSSQGKATFTERDSP
jgi:hypothetical protein